MRKVFRHIMRNFVAYTLSLAITLSTVGGCSTQKKLNIAGEVLVQLNERVVTLEKQNKALIADANMNRVEHKTIYEILEEIVVQLTKNPAHRHNYTSY